jgi:hypothetical protein
MGLLYFSVGIPQRRTWYVDAINPEIPYALPPGRFEDPKPLPAEFQYETKEYISESSCWS